MMHGQNNPTEVYKTASLTGERYVVPSSAAENQASNTYGSVHQTTSVSQPTQLITGNYASTTEYQQPPVTTREAMIPQMNQSSVMSYVREQAAPQIQTTYVTTTQGETQVVQPQQTTTTTTTTHYQDVGETTQGRVTHTTTGHQEEHTRKISSVVVESTSLMDVPEDTVRYVTVPVYEDEVEYKVKKEVRYLPGPPQEPEIRYKDVPVKTVKVVEEVVEVPIPNKLGPIVTEVVQPNPHTPPPVIEKVYRDVPVTNYVDHEVPVIVAQMTKPMIREHNEEFEVAARDFQPEIVHVDVHLVRPVDNTLQLIDKVRSSHKLVDIGAAQYNTLLRSLNAGSQCELPYVAVGGRIDYVPESELKYTIAPAGIKVEGWTPKTPTPPQFNSATGFENQAYQYTTSAGSGFVGQAQQTTENLTREARHLGAQRNLAPPTASGARSHTSSAYSANAAQQQLSSKAREVIESATKHNGEESRSSSVSSSINKIASQMQMRGQKRNYMCCGTGATDQNLRSQQRNVMDTATKALNQYSYPATDSAHEGNEQQPSARSHHSRSHHSRNTGTAPHSSAHQGGEGLATTSHHVTNSHHATNSHHISMGHPQTKSTRVC